MIDGNSPCLRVEGCRNPFLVYSAGKLVPVADLGSDY